MAVKVVPTLGWTSRSVAATILQMNQDQRRAMAQRVAVLMDAKGLTNESLAYKASVSVKTVSRVLNSRNESRNGTIEKLAKALEVTETELRGEPPSPLGLGGTSQLDRIERQISELHALFFGDAAAEVVADVVDRLEETAASPQPKAPARSQTRKAAGRRKPA